MHTLAVLVRIAWSMRAARQGDPVHEHAMIRLQSRTRPLAAAIGVLVLCATLAGCGAFKKKPVPKARVSSPTLVRDVPSPLRGTIGAEARVIGNESTLVSGIGFVVGLDGTGGLPMPEQYAAHLERIMGLNGVGIANDEPGSPLSGRSPRSLLQDPNTAAVFVQGAIPPGANTGESFDVYIRSINATSLEGGQLWTTELRIGPPSAFGDPKARILGSARGPIFVNPFTEQGLDAGGVVSQTVGRVLDGGVVTEPTKVQVILDSPSHQRIRQIVSAINAAFPMDPSERGQTARGVDDTYLLVQVPRAFKERRREFIELIEHLTIDQSYPEAFAQRYAGAMETQAYLAQDMSWCLQALGERALPYLRGHYDHPEAAPRLAALRAGASLDDPRCIEPLAAMARDEDSPLQTDAIALLARIDGSLVPDRTLRGLLDSSQLSVRVEAYEGLVARAIDARKRRLIEDFERRARASSIPDDTERQIDVFARVRVRNDPIRGVSRTLVGGKFFLDVVPFGEPLIYVTQQREPRVVLFGADPGIETPLLASALEDRFMLASDAPGDPIRMYYRDERARRTYTHDDVPRTLPELVSFLASEPTPGSSERGLGLSYSQVVSVLYQIHTDLGIGAGFTTERDQLLASLLKSSKPSDIEVRPETPGADPSMIPVDDPTRPVVEGQGERPVRRTLLVPVNPPKDDTAPEGPGGDDPVAPDPAPRREGAASERPDAMRPE